MEKMIPRRNEDTSCLICGGSHTTALGEPCPNCCKGGSINEELPVLPNIPIQYQGVKFQKMFLAEDLQGAYGTYMEQLLQDIVHGTAFMKNVLICQRPNSGKTVWAYTLFGLLYNSGNIIPDIKDIMEVRSIMFDYYGDEKESDMWSKAKVAIIKIPLDLPSHVFNTMSAVIERRVRNNGSTIFLYGGKKKDILSQDRFGVLKALEGDGAYNSIEIKSWEVYNGSY